MAICLVTCLGIYSNAQECRKLTITQQSQIAAACTAIPLTMQQDQQGLPYLYVANKEAGLKVYNIADIKKPKLASTISAKSFASLHVMNLTQDGNYLYLAIGNHFNNK